MKTALLHDVWRILRAARRRLAVRDFLGALVRCGLLAGAGLVVLGAANRWLLGRMPFDSQVALAAAAAVPVMALLVAVAGRKALPEVAVLLDRLGGTRDRFFTALTFAQDQSTSEMQALAVRECAAFVRGGDFRRLVRVRVPRAAGWLLVPVVALAMLQWEARNTLDVRLAETDAAQSEVEDTARKLEALARQTEQANAETKAEELQQIADQLKRSAAQLRAGATQPEDAAKYALRELSALEQMVEELRRPSGVSPEEMQELAKALAENEGTKAAAAALDAGQLAQAAAELEKALRQLAEKKDERTEQQIQQALEQALQRLAKRKQLSAALQKLAQQMPKPGANQSGQGGQAMRQLAQMLRQLPQGSRNPQSPGAAQKAEALQQVLAALQNMKYGEADGKPGGDPKPGEAKAQGLVKIESFAPVGPGGEPGASEPGQPGSERDAGTTDTPFGQERHDPGKTADARRLTGRLGEGESLSQFVPSAGDTSKSSRRYREIYEAMAPAAEDAAQQENIPLGSRFFIKRYFESIRPRE